MAGGLVFPAASGTPRAGRRRRGRRRPRRTARRGLPRRLPARCAAGRGARRGRRGHDRDAVRARRAGARDHRRPPRGDLDPTAAGSRPGSGSPSPPHPATRCRGSWRRPARPVGSPPRWRRASTAVRSCSSGSPSAAATPVDLDRVVVRDLTVQGCLGSPGIWPEVVALVAEGVVCARRRLLSHLVPALAGAAAAYALAAGREPGVRKVLVLPNGSTDAEHLVTLAGDDVTVTVLPELGARLHSVTAFGAGAWTPPATRPSTAATASGARFDMAPAAATGSGTGPVRVGRRTADRTANFPDGSAITARCSLHRGRSSRRGCSPSAAAARAALAVDPRRDAAGDRHRRGSPAGPCADEHRRRT